MEVLLRVALVGFFGILLLVANVSFLTSLARGVRGGDLVVAPIKVSGDGAATAALQESLAAMLVVRLKAITIAFAQSQSALNKNQHATPTAAPMMFGNPRSVNLRSKLFEPTNIVIHTSAVDVGGFLPQIERWFIRDRTLSFTVSVERDKTVISGDVDALGVDNAPPIWIQISDHSADAIVDALAYSIVQRAWSKDEPELFDLTLEEFMHIVQSVEDAATLNRRFEKLGTPPAQKYMDILSKINPIADRIVNWNQFTLFVASIAERSNDHSRASQLLLRVRENSTGSDRKSIGRKIEENGGAAAALAPYYPMLDRAYKELSEMFPGNNLPKPELKLVDYGTKNAFWDGSAVHMAPGLLEPDMLAHEIAHGFLNTRWHAPYEGEMGAVMEAYCDSLSAYVVQRMLNQSAATADWSVSPGAIAWILDEPQSGKRNQLPIRSLRAPGTAYVDHPLLGTDPQISNYKDYKKTGDNSEFFLNSGIGAKAFYETSIKIGTEKATKIWVEALTRFDVNTGYPAAARIIRETATGIYGMGSVEAVAVDRAWADVGLP